MMRCENDNDAMFLQCGGSERSDDTVADVHDPNHFGHGKFSLRLKDDRELASLKRSHIFVFHSNREAGRTTCIKL
jgi:hypothetical protein